MGTAGIAVVDSGPLIHLAEIGCMELLQLFENLQIPDAVWLEVVVAKRVQAEDILQLGNIVRQAVAPETISQFVLQNHLDDIHAGERECLYLCKSMKIPIILTDDLAVREAAKRLHVTPVGSLGVIIKAYRLGRISINLAENYIAALQSTSSLFVTKAIIEMALRQLHTITLRQN